MSKEKNISRIDKLVHILIPWASEQLVYKVRPQRKGALVYSFVICYGDSNDQIMGENASFYYEHLNKITKKDIDGFFQYVSKYFKAKGSDIPTCYAQFLFQKIPFTLLIQENVKKGICFYVDIFEHKNEFEQTIFHYLLNDILEQCPTPLLKKDHREAHFRKIKV